MTEAGTGGGVGRSGAGPLKLMVALAIAALLAAGVAWWFWPAPRVSPDDARMHRAEQACLSNTDSERGGKVTTEAGAKDVGVSAGAGITSSDRQARGPNERVATGDLLTESNAIRACIERHLAADKSPG